MLLPNRQVSSSFNRKVQFGTISSARCTNILLPESSSSASYGSTPNQGNASASEVHDPNANDSSTPCNAATGLKML